MNNNGLSEKQAAEHLKKYGLNILAQKNHFGFLFEFISSFFSPLVLLLLGASFISAILGDITDFLIILAIVLVSGTVTFWQHFKAEKTAEKLKQKVRLTATVIRDGKEKEIPFSHVTVGDVVIIGVGDIVPADATLFETRDMTIDESTLTGESFPAEKSLEKEKQTIYMGTHVITGEGKAVVTAIGKSTKFGSLSKELLTQKPTTSFDQGIANFSVLVVRAILALTIFVFLINAVLHHNLLQAFLFAVALAVGLAPELLPVILTVNLAKGALKMEKKEVIVKFLPAIQNLGSMDVLCTDKTGTLTESKIILEKSQGYDGKENEQTNLFGLINSTLQASFRNPMDVTLHTLHTKHDVKDYKKIDEIPFDFSRKSLSVIVSSKKSGALLICKGTVSYILEKISSVNTGTKTIPVTKTVLEKLHKEYEELSNQGFRVIAVAYKDISEKKTYTITDESSLIFSGFLVFSDPIKSTAHKTLQELEDLGIQVKVLTGDNQFVTQHICEKVGLPVEKILLGHEVDSFSDAELEEHVKRTSIFALLNPEQKARVITALKNTQHVVGYLGDGINDAPPLKTADVGISVHNGSDIAREVADIVLMKKSLEVLQEGVIEGRKTHVNILKYIMMEISSNFGNMVTLAGASLFLPFLPMLPVQILLNNFLYDMSQLALPTDHVDKDLIKVPRQWNIQFIKNFMLIFGPISSLFDFMTFFVLLYVLHASAAIFRTGWFLESFVTQTLIIFAIRTKIIPFFKSVPSKWLVIGSFSVLIAGVFLVISPLRSYFMFDSLPIIFYLFLIIAIILYFIVVEATKAWFFKRNSFL